MTTGARASISTASAPASSRSRISHAPETFTTPFPCLYAAMCGTQRAPRVIAYFSRYGSIGIPACRAALISNAPAPAAVGVAVEVPPAIVYPGGSSNSPAIERPSMNPSQVLT